MRKYFLIVWKYLPLILGVSALAIATFRNEKVIHRSTWAARKGKAAKRGKDVDPRTGEWIDRVEPEPVESADGQEKVAE